MHAHTKTTSTSANQEDEKITKKLCVRIEKNGDFKIEQNGNQDTVRIYAQAQRWKQKEEEEDNDEKAKKKMRNK